MSGGWNNGSAGLFGAGNFFVEDGWRDNSPSKVNQVFGKGSYRSDRLDLNLSSLYVWNDLVGNGLIPGQMYAQDRNGVFYLAGHDEEPAAATAAVRQHRQRQLHDHRSGLSAQQRSPRTGRRRLYRAQGRLRAAQLDPEEEYTCLYNSTNKYGLPDYYVVAFDPNDWFRRRIRNSWTS